jgi:hypothetical protein
MIFFEGDGEMLKVQEGKFPVELFGQPLARKSAAFMNQKIFSINFIFLIEFMKLYTNILLSCFCNTA